MTTQLKEDVSAGVTPGTLFVVGTPLGNLEDITLRAKRILQEVDLVAAEDTRRTGRLLEHLGIHKPIVSYYQHNEQARTEELINRLHTGTSVALVTDAGMPGISDPGYVIIQSALAQHLTVIPIPGPTAATTALVISGLSTERYVFEGFLPRAGKSRRERLAALAHEERTMVIYEAPHRLLRTLADVLENWGNRQAALARELTKIHEECVRGDVNYLINHFSAHAPKGECVLVVGGIGTQADDGVTAAESEITEVNVQQLLVQAIQNGLSRRDAVKQVTAQTGLPRRDVYQASLQLTNDTHT